MRNVLIGAVGSTELTLETMVSMEVTPVAVFSVESAISHRNSDFVDLGKLCKSFGVPFYLFRDINDVDILRSIETLQPDFLWVIGLSQIVKKALLGIPRFGTIGFHPSKLPRNRGRGVIAWTILQGVSKTGSTLFWIDEGVDSGPILKQKTFPVDHDETVSSLMKKHGDALREMLKETLPYLKSVKNKTDLPATIQDSSEATWCARRIPQDGLIDWRLNARDIWTLIRASGRPYPGAFTTWQNKEITVWSAELREDLDGIYWGIPGQIQTFFDGFPLVQCGDTHHLMLTNFSIRGESGESLLGKDLRLHERLGGKNVQ